MSVSNKNSFFRLIAFMLILTTFLPVVQNNLPVYIGSHHFFAAIWLASILFFYPRILKQKTFLFFLFYGLLFVGLILNTLWIDMEDWDRRNIIQEFYVFSVAITVLFYFILENDYIGLARITKWSLVFIGITAIMSIYSASVNPMYARLMTSGGWESIKDKEYFDTLGGGGYGFVASLIALFPMMVYYYRNHSNSIFSRKIILLFGALCFITLLKTQFFANILLSAVIIIVSLLGRKRIKQSLLVISLFLIVFFIIPTHIYADFFTKISTYFNPGSDVSYKLNDFSKYLELGDNYGTSTGDRAARYPLLIEAFFEKPLMGYYTGSHIKNISAGVHLYWMNRLAIMGLFGFIPLLVIHISYIKTSIKYFNEQFTFYFLVSVFSVVGLGLMKALTGRELWFTYFILLPGLYFLPLLKKEKKE